MTLVLIQQLSKITFINAFISLTMFGTMHFDVVLPPSNSTANSSSLPISQISLEVPPLPTFYGGLFGLWLSLVACQIMLHRTRIPPKGLGTLTEPLFPATGLHTTAVAAFTPLPASGDAVDHPQVSGMPPSSMPPSSILPKSKRRLTFDDETDGTEDYFVPTYAAVEADQRTQGERRWVQRLTFGDETDGAEDGLVPTAAAVEADQRTQGERRSAATMSGDLGSLFTDELRISATTSTAPPTGQDSCEAAADEWLESPRPLCAQLQLARWLWPLPPLMLAACACVMLWGAFQPFYRIEWGGLGGRLLRAREPPADQQTYTLASFILHIANPQRHMGIAMRATIIVLLFFIWVVTPLVWLLALVWVWAWPLTTAYRRRLQAFADAVYAWTALDAFLVTAWCFAPNMHILLEIILGKECERLGIDPLLRSYFSYLVAGEAETCVTCSATYLSGGYVMLAACVVAFATAQGIACAHRRAEAGSYWVAWRPSGRTLG